MSNESAIPTALTLAFGGVWHFAPNVNAGVFVGWDHLKDTHPDALQMGVQQEALGRVWCKPKFRKRQSSKQSAKRKSKAEIKVSNITHSYIGKFQSKFLIHLISQIFTL